MVTKKWASKKTAAKSRTGKSNRAVYIVDGNRTPFLKARGVPGPFTASDLTVYSGR